MEEFITAVREILEDATANGGTLEGAVLAENENNIPRKDIILVVHEVNETFLENVAFDYEIVTGRIMVTVLSRIKKGELTPWKKAMQTARQWGKKVRQTLLQNSKLISTSYPDGVAIDEKYTKIPSIVYGYGTVDTAWFAFSRLEMETRYLYRAGTLAMQ